MSVNELLAKVNTRLQNIFEKQILTNFLVLLLVALIVLSLSLPFYLRDFTGFVKEVLAEAHGMIFDIAIIGILIYWLNKRGERTQMIRAYKDEIDDFRLWESEEAAFRTAGNIKRLNRHKIYDINLYNCYLSKANLNHVVLKNANLNNANLLNSNLVEADFSHARLNQTHFENSNMNQANLTGAYANGAVFKDSNMIKSKFVNAFLIKADFSNAFLMEADLRGAYLTGADLSNCNLYKADLRGVRGLSIEQLLKVRTLYLAKFDREIEEVLWREHPEYLGTNGKKEEFLTVKV